MAIKIKSTKFKNLIFNIELKNGTIDNDKINEPNEPETVLFGLIFVNFLPLKIFPNDKPPISEQIQMENKKSMVNLKFS